MERVRNIAISGSIGSGTTSLGRVLAEKLGWQFVEGGEVFAGIHRELGISEENVAKRQDTWDIEFDKKMQSVFQYEEKNIIESHLAGYNARGIIGIFKIRLVCETNGVDQIDERARRIARRDGISVGEAKRHLLERERGNIEKYERIYGLNPYQDSSLYDVTINTFKKSKEAVLKEALKRVRK
jgi:cytidylate kinase